MRGDLWQVLVRLRQTINKEIRRVSFLELGNQILAAARVAADGIDAQRCIGGDQVRGDKRRQQRDRACRVAARVADTPGCGDSRPAGGVQFGEAENPFRVRAMRSRRVDDADRQALRQFHCLAGSGVGQAEDRDIRRRKGIAPRRRILAPRGVDAQQVDVAAPRQALADLQAGRSRLAVDEHLGHAHAPRRACLFVPVLTSSAGKAQRSGAGQMRSDILVIGGGMAGISAAARLAGQARVTVLEAEERPGYHSTGRSAAIFILNYGGPVLRALNSASQPFLAAPDEIEETSLLTPRGELLIAAPDELAAFDAYTKEAAGLTSITAREALSLVPILREERIAAAAHEEDAQDIDVDRMLQGFLRLLRRHGGNLVGNARVNAISRQSGVWIVETPGGSFAAPILVNAAGGWADAVAGLAGAEPKGLRPLRRSAAVIPAPDGHDVASWPMFGSAGETWYAKPDAGKLMVSPADQTPVEPHDVWPDDMTLAEGIARYEEAVTVPVTRLEHSWAGMRTFAPDGVPVVGFDARVEGFFWLAGQGGYGIQTAPALSMLAADLILGRNPSQAASLVDAIAPGRPALGA